MEDIPDFLTVEEAAKILRIGRTAAYQLARLWRETDGRDGLPVVPLGRLLRVPRAALEVLSGGPLTGSTLRPESGRDQRHEAKAGRTAPRRRRQGQQEREARRQSPLPFVS
jgi:hypothetical protein